MSTFPKPGQWVRWLTPEFGREGQVVEAAWPSLVIRWLGVDEPQVFPYGYMYFEPGASSRMEFISKPKGASPNRQRQSRELMGMSEAAELLGKPKKQIRSMLRAGKLEGIQRDGRWVGVYL